MIYPWHEAAWSQLQSGGFQRHHALLLHGAAGIGKQRFAEILAQSLLCSSPVDRGLPCGQCSNCRWFGQEGHPDFRRLTPEALRVEMESAGESATEEASRGDKKTATQITIEQVRELQGFMSLTIHRTGGMRVVMIHPADSMNIFAANALLKMLEEPPAHSIFLLITADLRRLLPTIVSRCRRFPLPGATKVEAEEWLRQQSVAEPEVLLAQAGGAPLTALAMAGSAEQSERRDFFDRLVCLNNPGAALELAAGFQKMPVSTVVRWLLTWCYDLMAVCFAGTIRYHVDYRDAIRMLAKRMSVDQMLVYQDLLKDAARSVAHPLNPRLFLERLLLSYTHIITTSSASEHV